MSSDNTKHDEIPHGLPLEAVIRATKVSTSTAELVAPLSHSLNANFVRKPNATASSLGCPRVSSAVCLLPIVGVHLDMLHLSKFYTATIPFHVPLIHPYLSSSHPGFKAIPPQQERYYPVRCM